MTAFERIQSGIPEMDRVLDNIRLGDNVVWRVSGLDEFHLFLDPYVRQAIADHRRLIYVRFASHPPLVSEQEGVETVTIELSHRFETFTVEIHNLITKTGRGAFYVFDCLSELQTAWATDLMMGNFFRVTCPYLYQLDTVAYFPLIRGMHSFQAIAKIRDTTQLFLDVYSDSRSVYVRPDKVWNRYSETMFLPHIYRAEQGSFRPILDGVEASRFYQVMNDCQSPDSEQNMDFWDRFFNQARVMYAAGMDITEPCSRMCNIMMSRDERMRVMIKKHFTPQDYFRVRNHICHELWLDFSTPPYYHQQEPKSINGCNAKMIELFVNDEYRGIYSLLEPVDRKQLKIKKYKKGVKGCLWKTKDWHMKARVLWS